MRTIRAEMETNWRGQKRGSGPSRPPRAKQEPTFSPAFPRPHNPQAITGNSHPHTSAARDACPPGRGRIRPVRGKSPRMVQERKDAHLRPKILTRGLKNPKILTCGLKKPKDTHLYPKILTQNT
jgi:hypothetical protein